VTGDVSCVQHLAGLVGVPARRTGRFDWAAIEESVRLPLPADYKELVETFPDGTFQGLVRVNRPGDDGYPREEFLGFYAYRLDDMRGWRSAGHGDFPYPIHPEPGGLLPWASGPRLEPVFWLTGAGDPDEWPVVTADADFRDWRVFPGGACQFLTEVVLGRFGAGQFGADLSGPPRFTAAAPASQPEPEPAAVAPAPFLQATGRAVDEFAMLAKTLGPAQAPAPPVDWPLLERQLELALPADYKSFVDTYGAGEYCDITIAAPGGPTDADLLSLMKREYLRIRDPGRRSFDGQLYPERGGIVPWGSTRGGWLCGWAPTTPDPNRWGVVVIDPEITLVHHTAHLSFSAFLLAYLDPDGGTFPSRVPWSGPATYRPLR
jgi:hypothetical protein